MSDYLFYNLSKSSLDNASDNLFNNTTRITEDNSDKSQQNIQNVAQANWCLTNYGSSDCNMTKSIDFALSNGPGINYSGSHQVGIGGCQIDTNSELTIPRDLRPVGKLGLFERPFLTVPYLGRGAVNISEESFLMRGTSNSNKKTANPTKSQINRKMTPLIPEVASTINNPANLVEGVADEGWIRGGLPSRELTKDKNYVTSHTKSQYL